MKIVILLWGVHGLEDVWYGKITGFARHSLSPHVQLPARRFTKTRTRAPVRRKFGREKNPPRIQGSL